MVISMAIPSATLNINTVDGLSGIPAQPMMPAVITNGITFGINQQMSTLKDLNKYSMHKAINAKAHMILSFKPLMIKRLPSKNVMLVPVSCTLYWGMVSNFEKVVSIEIVESISEITVSNLKGDFLSGSR